MAAEHCQCQQLWSWGAGTDGQLGTEKLEDEYLPQLIPFNLSSPIHFIACGGAHVVALTSDGKAFSWGRGASGQLGHGNTANTLTPKPITSLNQHFITHASAGWDFSGFVSDSGELFVCGNSSFGQLGLGDYTSHSSPVKHPILSKNIALISCGLRHSLVLLKSTEKPLYILAPPKLPFNGPQILPPMKYTVSGTGIAGSLDPIRNQMLFQSLYLVYLLLVLSAYPPMEIIVLPFTVLEDQTHFQTIILCNIANGDVLLWGRSFTSNSSSASMAASPWVVTSPSSSKFCHVALGWNHALLLTDEGELFIIGKHKGMTFIGDDGMRRVKSARVAQVAAGAEHSVIVTENGEVMTWGWAEHGQLGLGHQINQTDPQCLTLDASFPIVFSGAAFSFALTTTNKTF